MRRLLAAVFVILALFAVSNVYAGELSATKCTVTAGKTEGYGTILVSGEMNAAADDLSDADNIQVTIDSNDMVSPCVQSFPINETTLKNGKYKCSKTENSSKTSFTFGTKTSKFSFTAKNVDLSGLGCPLTIEIEIGDYICTAEVDETIVNGTKKPIPIKLMTGVKNVLRVDKYQVKQNNKKSDSDQLSVAGGFAVEDTTVNMTNRVSEGLVVTLGTQTFTIPANKLKAGEGKFTCSKADVTEGGIASATFNFTACSFTMTIKNVDITSSGDVEFCVEFADFSECVPVALLCTFTISPTAKSFTASGGDDSVTVTTSNECAWTALSNDGWITIDSGSSGSGSGTVGYSVAANGGTANRTGTMTISGHTFTVTQAAPTGGGVLPSEGIVFVSGRDGWNGIWVMNTDGSNPRRLSSVAKDWGGDGYPSSSPDGSKIVFARDGTGIVVLDNSGEEIVKNYTSGEGPWYTTWSYNGTIYFTRLNLPGAGAKEYIYSVNEDGTGEVQVSPLYDSVYDASDRDPSISPDGTTLIFSTNREGRVGIAKMIIGSGSLVYLTDITGSGSATITPAEQPSWSPDGSKIAFSAYPGYPDWTRKEQIYVMNADGSGKVPLTSETGADCIYPSWSPDGSKIVFQKEYPGFSGYNEIWIMNADGSGGIALTDRNVTISDEQPCFIKKPR